MQVRILWFVLMILGGSIAYSAQNELGIGMILGDPTGVSIKYYLSEEHAVDGAVAWSMKYNEYFRLHADYLFHDRSVLRKSLSLPLELFYGGGGTMMVSNGINLGMRGVIGFFYLFKKPKIDLFLEIAPGIYLIPETRFNMDAGLGARIFFRLKG